MQCVRYLIGAKLVSGRAGSTGFRAASSTTVVVQSRRSIPTQKRLAAKRKGRAKAMGIPRRRRRRSRLFSLPLDSSAACLRQGSWVGRLALDRAHAAIPPQLAQLEDGQLRSAMDDQRGMAGSVEPCKAGRRERVERYQRQTLAPSFLCSG